MDFVGNEKLIDDCDRFRALMERLGFLQPVILLLANCDKIRVDRIKWPRYIENWSRYKENIEKTDINDKEQVLHLIVDCYRSNHDDRNWSIKTFEINDMTNLERIGEIHLNVWNILQRHVLCQSGLLY